jgi:hypothetical protein
VAGAGCETSHCAGTELSRALLRGRMVEDGDKVDAILALV